MTHDYRRHGTTTPFAALNTATSEVLTDCKPRHRHQEFLAFLELIELHASHDRDVHLVIEDYGPSRRDTPAGLSDLLEDLGLHSEAWNGVLSGPLRWVHPS